MMTNLIKTFTKIILITVIGTIIVMGLSSCFSKAKPTGEEITFWNMPTYRLRTASWNVERLEIQPPLDGYDLISRFLLKEPEHDTRAEVSFFSYAGGDGEKDRGKMVTVSDNGINSPVKLIGLDADTWYLLTAPEIHSRVFIYYRADGNVNLYRKII